MDLNSPDELDALIESALSSEPPRRVPPHLRGRIDERLRIAALLEGERRRFLRPMKSAVFPAAAAIAAAAVCWHWAGGLEGLLYRLPGVAHALDHARALYVGLPMAVGAYDTGSVATAFAFFAAAGLMAATAHRLLGHAILRQDG